MKKILKCFYVFLLCFSINVISFCVFSLNICNATSQPVMSIIIDDFGSYYQSEVETILSIDKPLTCAVIPLIDNTKQNIEAISKTHHELILHMPMQAHINLPESWYGKTYIKIHDNQETINKKFEECLKDFPQIKGFNIHIGSGVSSNQATMTRIYNYAKENNLYFLDSRTIETKATEKAAKETNSLYLGRDYSLDADKNKSYSHVRFSLLEGAKKAIANGSSIVIGHVGAEGGEQTAKAIRDTIPEIEKMGVKIVPLSEIYNLRNSQK